ncbi:MAG: hypothetical protein FD124_3948, partial [Alphaproteobacteria bacterium]
MQGNEEIGALASRDGDALFEGDEDVGIPGQDDPVAATGLKLVAQRQGRRQDNLLFPRARRAMGARIFSAMAGVDHDHPVCGADQRRLSGLRRGLRSVHDRRRAR